MARADEISKGIAAEAAKVPSLEDALARVDEISQAVIAEVDAAQRYKSARIEEEPEPEPGFYEPVRCQCGDMDCEDWRITRVADVWGVKFSDIQAVNVAYLLNHLREQQLQLPPEEPL